ncbi:hypothetical protein PMAYCL1PPCAC_18987, partial [Pristionchus mayeri]
DLLERLERLEPSADLFSLWELFETLAPPAAAPPAAPTARAFFLSRPEPESCSLLPIFSLLPLLFEAEDAPLDGFPEGCFLAAPVPATFLLLPERADLPERLDFPELLDFPPALADLVEPPALADLDPPALA